MMDQELAYWKERARLANAADEQQTVGMIIAKHLEPLFGDDHRAARAFYTELEQTAPAPTYNPMQGD